MSINKCYVIVDNIYTHWRHKKQPKKQKKPTKLNIFEDKSKRKSRNYFQLVFVYFCVSPERKEHKKLNITSSVLLALDTMHLLQEVNE